MSQPLAMETDFNSSDMEFEPRKKSKRSPRAGQRSINAIIKDAEIDRVNSKKTLQQLEYGRRAPGTMDTQNVWVNRLNTFRIYTLKQSLDEPFTGDDLIRFFDSIVGKPYPHRRTQPI